MPQVDRDHYQFEKYVGLDRWSSYHYQLREILATRPATVLEIGVGDSAVGMYVKRNTAIRYTSCDMAKDLNPDVVGSVTALPFPDGSFDTICAFEVLEHLPFEEFPEALKELRRVSKKHVLLSLPHFGPPVQFRIKIPFLPRLSFSWKIPFSPQHRFDGEHHWEIGKRGYPPRRIRALLQEQFSILREFIPFENQYHHFFILKKK